MSSLRLPIRLLESADVDQAYPRELVADFSTGDLILINKSGSRVDIPNAISTEVSGTGNAITGITASGKKLVITKGNFLTAHPTITMSTNATGNLTPAFGGSFSVIDSITKDSNGHVTKISTKSVKLPAAPTSVSGAAGSAAEFTAEQEIALTGDITGSASSKAGWSIAATLANSGATAGSYGPSANATPAFGATFNVPYVTVDAKGRITSISTKTVKIPAAPTTVSGNAGTATKFSAAQKVELTGDVTGSASSQAGWSVAATLASIFDEAPGAIGPEANVTLKHNETFSVPQVTVDAKGRVTAITTRTIKLPAYPSTISGNAGTATKFSAAQKVELTGDVTGSASSQAGWSVEATLASLYTTAPGAVGPAANASPAHGGTFTVPQVTVDIKGRVTTITGRTITLPAAPTSVSGNAGTATKFSAAQKVELTGDVTGSASSQAGWSVAATLASIFATAPGAVGPAANASPAHGGTFTVPQVTVDAKGRVTAIAGRTITLPSAPGVTVSSSGTGDFVKSISANGNAISYVKGSAASTVTYKVNIGTNWSGSAAPYTQTISVSGMLATDNPIVDVLPDSTYDTAVSQIEAWGNIHRITTAANSITVYANDKTEVAVPIQIKCIRG